MTLSNGEGEELSSLQLVLCCDDNLGVCSGLVDPSDPEWRAKVREDVLFQNDQDPEIKDEIGAQALCADDEEEKESEIKSDREALQMAILSKSTDLFQDIVIRNQKESSIYYNSLRNNVISTIGERLASEIPSSDIEPETYLPPTETLFSLTSPSLDVVYKLLSELNEGKSTGFSRQYSK